MSRSWVDDEPGWSDVRREIARAARRARARWLLTAVLTLALTGAIVAFRSRQARMYGATVVFLVTEGRFDPQSAPPTSARLQDHIWNVSLSGSRLLGVIKEHNLYPTRLRSDPGWAVEAMRDDLDVKVVRNFFSQERSANDPPRSARLAISYRAEDPQLAHDVVTHLGRLVAEQQTEVRKLSSKIRAEHARVATARVREELQMVRAQQASLNMQLATASPDDAPMIQIRLHDVTARIAPLEASLTQAERMAAEFDLRTAFEGQDMGLRFDLIDPGRPPTVKLSRSAELAILGLASLLLLTPFVALGVGAFDPRIYIDDDVMRLGLDCFGHVPAFPGDGFGAMPDRRPYHRGTT